MKTILASLIFFLAFNLQTNAQEFLTYTVKQDDTATSLAKRFNTTIQEIYRFNPDAKNGLRKGAVLVIPKSTSAQNNTANSKDRTPKTFKTHKVKRKETLYSLSKEYNVTVDEIKRYNKWLYAEQLKRKDKIRIPVYPNVVISDTQTVEDPRFIIKEEPVVKIVRTPSGKTTHTVQAKEGKYGISRKYGMTIAELEAMNPDMEEPIQPGQVLNVKGEASTESTVITDERFTFYEVKPKENFFRLEQRFNISEDSLIALNPKLEEGLKVGMIIKIPKKNTSIAFGNDEIVNLEASIRNYDAKTVALLLPFNSHKITNDSLSNTEERIKRDRVMRISLDFYSGALVALEEGKQKGLSTTLRVFDTEQSTSKVRSIINDNNFNDVDVVVGPLLNSTVEEASALLNRKDIPVISPLSSRKANGRENLIQSRPTDDMLHEVILSYLEAMHTDQNIVILADDNASSIKSLITSKFPTASTLKKQEDNFVYQNDVSRQLVSGKDNWFIVATEDVALLSNLLSYLNAYRSKHNIQLFALEKTSAFDSEDVSNDHLSNLKFTFPSVDKEFDYENKAKFIIDYNAKYGIAPNKYAVRGYHIMYDTLLRLANSDTYIESLENNIATEYIENKFSYVENGISGYMNNGIYIMQYGENLTLKPVE